MTKNRHILIDKLASGNPSFEEEPHVAFRFSMMQLT